MEPIKVVDGEFITSADQVAWMNTLIKRVVGGNKPEDHLLLAQTILGPIQKIAEYEEWTADILGHQTRTLSDVIRVALDSPTMIAFYTSTSAGGSFQRPGRTFTTVSLKAFDVGIEVGLDQLETFGWDVLARKMKEAGWELARKRDDVRKTVIDAAVSNTSSVATDMSKASVDALFVSAAQKGFPITRAYINAGTIMDMTAWTWPSNSMWNRLGADRAEQVLKNGYVTAYGGAQWLAFRSVAAGYVYFMPDPQYVGWDFKVNGHPRTFQERSISEGPVDRYLYQDKLGAYAIGNNWYRLAIT